MIDPSTGTATLPETDPGGPRLDARTQRTLVRLLALFLAAGAGDALIQFFTAGTYDFRHLVGALGVAFVMAIEKYLSESSSSMAAPTVRAVNVALADHEAVTGAPIPVTVPPPSQPTPPAP